MSVPFQVRPRPVYALPDPRTLPFPGSLVRGCTSCELHKLCRAPVPGKGPTPAPLMFVGEAPGFDEDNYGFEPFVGRAGKQLDSCLQQAGVERLDAYLTNAIHCRPPNNADPKPHQIAACARWLDTEIELVDPKIIIALGLPAVRRILGPEIDSMEHCHGKPVVARVGASDRIVLPCYHPAAGLHNTALLRHLYDDFQVLRGLLNGQSPEDFHVVDEYPNPVYRVVDTPALLREVQDEARSAGQFAIDVETVNRDTKMWSAQISSIPGTAWFIPRWNCAGKLDVTKWDAEAIFHFYLGDVRWVDADKFQDTMVMAYLLGLPQGLKTLAWRLLGVKMTTYREMTRPQQRTLSLQYLVEAAARDWPDPPAIERAEWDNKVGRVVVKTKHPWHITRRVKRILLDADANPAVDPWDRWNDIDAPVRADVEKRLGLMPEASLAEVEFAKAVDYGCRDAMVTLRVKNKLLRLIQEADMEFVLHMDTGILPAVYSMMQIGMAVSPDHFRALSSDYRKRMADTAGEAGQIVGHPFNPMSSVQVAKVVYDELGFTPTKLTATKEISTDDMELKKVKHSVVKPILMYRRLSKVCGTYAEPLAHFAIPDRNGIPRIHTTIKTTRVETGRLSSSDPVNLQNIPTRSKEGKRIRVGFVAPPGSKIGEGDYGQIEICTQAHLAKCKGLIELFNRGGDPHTETASRIFGVPLDVAAQDKYRYPCKRAGFGVIYLIGAMGLAAQIQEYISDLEMDGEKVEIDSWSEEDCAKFISDYYKLYPEIRYYQMDKAAQARRLGFVSDIFNRRRFIPEVFSPIKDIAEAGLRQAANMPVTASAQGIIKLAMAKLHRELPGTLWADSVRILMQIHDSLVFEVADDDQLILEYLTWMRRVMTGVVKLLVPVKVDFKIGDNWAETKKYKWEVAKS